MTDLISRADARGAVQDHFNAYGFKGYYDGQQMMDRINALPSVDAVEVDRTSEWVAVRREEYEDLIADAVPIHEDGTLEVKVPNAQRVGRVLVMDTESHIGGGLFYPDDAEAEWIPCSERLPKDGVAVLITTENGEVYIVQVITDPYKERYFQSNTAYDNFQVIAWRPLPMPYREDDEA